MRITVAKGDGIGPEIMDATLKILFAAGATFEVDEIEVGEKVYPRTCMPTLSPSSSRSDTRAPAGGADAS